MIAIIGILAAIAYPSYGDHVRKTRRSDAHVALLEQRQAFERCRALRYSYAGCTLSRTTSPENFYTLSLSPTPTANAFTIVAEATGAQTNDADCKKLTIDQRDQALAYDKDGASSGVCW